MAAGLTELAIAALVFVGTHLGVSSTPLRAALVERLGRRAFIGLFSAISTATLVWLVWAFVLWAAAHMVPNGNIAALIFFGSLLGLSVAGMRLLDAKHARRLGADWARFAAVTSAVPFAATIAARNRPSLPDIGWTKIAGGVALYAILLLLHHAVIGKSPWPV
jgi:uncharacterized membrane protein